MYEIHPADKEKKKEVFAVSTHILKILVLFIPALFGYLLHVPLYAAVKKITGIYFDNDHYDSVVHSLLMLAYPLYLLLLAVITAIFLGVLPALSLFVLLPFAAWAWVQVKYDVPYLQLFHKRQ